MVRPRAFDVGELALMTYLQTKAYGKPLVLVPAVLLARFQHGDCGLPLPRRRYRPAT
jgi:4,5-dihydroxyphthalate decarboxylase